MTTQKDLKERDIEYHRQTAGYYDETITRVHRIYHEYALHPYLDRQRDDLSEQKVLDLGCGTGVVTLALAERGYQVVALDHSHEMIELARHKAQSSGLLDRVSFVVGDVESLEFDDDEFDGVTCQGLLHHLQDKSASLAELNRVLKPAGFFYISEPCADETIVKKGMRGGWSVLRVALRREKQEVESDEAPVSSSEISYLLDDLGLQHESRFLTHIPLLDRLVSDSVRISITRLISYPWMKKAGDLIFIYGQKPSKGA